jgi:hypothetical protein
MCRFLSLTFAGDTGFPIVFVQHLDPNHHSVLAEILERATAQVRGRGRKSMGSDEGQRSRNGSRSIGPTAVESLET